MGRHITPSPSSDPRAFRWDSCDMIHDQVSCFTSIPGPGRRRRRSSTSGNPLGMDREIRRIPSLQKTSLPPGLQRAMIVRTDKGVQEEVDVKHHPERRKTREMVKRWQKTGTPFASSHVRFDRNTSCGKEHRCGWSFEPIPVDRRDIRPEDTPGRTYSMECLLSRRRLGSEGSWDTSIWSTRIELMSSPLFYYRVKVTLEATHRIRFDLPLGFM